MAIKFRVNEEEYEALDAVIQGEYAREGDEGDYTLSVEGVVPESDIERLRKALDGERRTAAQRKRDLARFEGVDPEKWAAMLAAEEERAARGAAGPDPADIQKYLEGDDGKQLLSREMSRRFEGARNDYEEKIGALTTRETGLTRQLEELLIDQAMAAEVTHPDFPFRLAHPTALDDIKRRARSVFKVEDGKVVPYGEDGQVLYGKDPETPISKREWLAELATKCPMYFAGSSGSGGPAGPRGNNDDERGAPAPRRKRSEMTSRDKAAFIAKYGQEAFLKLPA